MMGLHVWVSCADDMHVLVVHGTVYSLPCCFIYKIGSTCMKSIFNIVFGYNIHTIINGVYTKYMVISEVILFTKDKRTWFLSTNFICMKMRYKMYCFEHFTSEQNFINIEDEDVQQLAECGG